MARHLFSDATIIGVEKQQLKTPPPMAYTAWETEDALTYLEKIAEERTPFKKFNLIMGNPPFYLFGVEHVERWFDLLRKCLRPEGRIVFFARAAITETDVRYDSIYSWWPPISITSYVKRVSFYPEGHPRCGATNARHHSLFVWENPEGKMQQGEQKTLYGWEWRALNDNNKTIDHPFAGKITWQDMIAAGLVANEETDDGQ